MYFWFMVVYFSVLWQTEQFRVKSIQKILHTVFSSQNNVYVFWFTKLYFQTFQWEVVEDPSSEDPDVM